MPGLRVFRVCEVWQRRSEDVSLQFWKTVVRLFFLYWKKPVSSPSCWSSFSFLVDHVSILLCSLNISQYSSGDRAWEANWSQSLSQVCWEVWALALGRGPNFHSPPQTLKTRLAGGLQGRVIFFPLRCTFLAMMGPEVLCSPVRWRGHGDQL